MSENEQYRPTADTVNAANQHHLQTNSVITNFT